MIIKKTSLIIFLTTISVFISGCEGSKNPDDLKVFIQEIQNKPAQSINEIPEIKKYEPYNYQTKSRSPFTPQKTQVNNNLNTLLPNKERPREPLEQFEMDSLTMKGTITYGYYTYALLEAPDNIVYKVRKGNYVGQNYGRIISISEQGVYLREIIPDGIGGYKYRNASIAYSE